MDQLFLKLWQKLTPSKIAIDNYASRLHYQLAFGICLAATGIIGGTSMGIGKAIQCFDTNSGKEDEKAEANCWESGTRRCDLEHCKSGKDGYNCEFDDDLVDLDMKWYKFGALMLFFNAVVFRISHQIWKIYEGGVMRKLYSADARAGNQNVINAVLGEIIPLYIQMIGNHRSYYGMFVFSQFLNILVVIGIFIFNYVILVGDNLGFLFYGTDAIKYAIKGNQGEENKAMCNMFPTRKTICWLTGTSSPDHQNTNTATCSLNQNVYNQIIYLVLWFLYCTLIIVGIFQLIFEAALIFQPRLRTFLIERQLGPAMRNDNDRQRVATCVNGRDIGDWFLLYQIGKNMDRLYFMEFLRRVAEQLPNAEENILMLEHLPDA